MKLKLVPYKQTAKSIISSLYITDSPLTTPVFECFILEDCFRADPKPETPQNEAKVYGETAIPAGTFELVLHNSPHFGEVLMLVGVPGYELVYIHWGNTPKDTLGCLLTGRKLGNVQDEVLESKIAFVALFTKVRPVLKRGEKVYIEVTRQ